MVGIIANAETGSVIARKSETWEAAGVKYIALDDFEFGWTLNELDTFREMWKQGVNMRDMAVVLGREEVEVTVLIFDQWLAGHIELRPNSILGKTPMTAAYKREEQRVYGRFTESDLAKMKRLFDQGCTVAEVAEEFEVSKAYIRLVKKDMGWTKRAMSA